MVASQAAKPDDEPLREVEGTEEDLGGGLKGFAERGEDLDARFAGLHGGLWSGLRGSGKPGWTLHS